MITAPPPPNEKERLRALQSYEILDTEPEAGFDDLTELARRGWLLPADQESHPATDGSPFGRQWWIARPAFDAPSVGMRCTGSGRMRG